MKKLIFSLMLIFCVFGKNQLTLCTALIDCDSFRVIKAENLDKRIRPASLVKIMALLIAFKHLEEGKLSLYDRVIISKQANRQPPSRLDVPSGKSLTVKDAISLIITKSANNVTCALAEKISGSERKFAKLMNIYAKKIGLDSTHFENATGLHHPNQYTSVRDLAKLSLCLLKSFPDKYYWFRTKSYSYNGVKYCNHNTMLGHTKLGFAIDGIKTGFTSKSGYNIIVSATSQGKRLMAIVTGARTPQERQKTVNEILVKGFAKTHRNTILVSKNTTPSKTNY